MKLWTLAESFSGKRLWGASAAVSLLGLLFFPVPGLAQQWPCAMEIPLGVILPDGRVVRGVTLRDFTVQLGGRPLTVDSLTADTAPRRILLVLDLGQDFSSSTRRAEAKMASHLLSMARTGDSFALLTVHGALRQMRFDAAPGALTSLLNELENDPKEKGSKLVLLEAILEGINWFGDPRPGDAIVVMTKDIPPAETRKYKEVSKALAEHRIRLFVVQLGPVITGIHSMAIVMGPHDQLMTSASISPNAQTLSALTTNSGGYPLMLGIKDPHREFKLTDTELQWREEAMMRIYSAITEFYRLRIQVPSPGDHSPLRIDLAPDLRTKSVKAVFIYPRQSVSCTPYEPKN